MTDKERLDAIKGRAMFSQLAKRTGEITHNLFTLDADDYDWLIEQAERAQELERKIERYRKVLAFYADEETYETKFATDTDEIFDPFTLIELDEGEKARQVLEGEE